MINKLYDFLCRVDKDFPTALSARIDLRGYAIKLAEKAFLSATIRDDRIVGLVAIYCNDIENRYAYIPLVAVDRDYRGQKISKSLMTCAIIYAKDNGFNILGLHAENPIALKLYKTLGFSIIQESGPRKYLELDLSNPFQQ